MNTERFGLEFSLVLAFRAGKPTFEIRPAVESSPLRLEDIDGVYFRDPRLPELNHVAREHRAFARREVAEQLRSLWRLIDESRWLNHPRNVWLASNKVEQLLVASQAGLRIPETRVTSDPDEVERFTIDCGGEAIVKAVRNGFEFDGEELWFAPTRRITLHDAETLQGYATIPATYQELLRKECDLRVTLVGDRLFSTAIRSQAHPETSIDWRTWDFLDLDLVHEPVELPPKVASGCRSVAQEFGLRFAAIDLVLTTDGEYFFLELNPNGQWAWLEQKAQHPIRDAIINALLPERAISTASTSSV